MINPRHLVRAGLVLAILALMAAPVSAGTVIYAGSDLWQTPDDGSTYADFRQDPIPADFFCSGSPAFAGRIEFKGAPLTTSPPNVLGVTDTIVLRLDDALLNARGVGVTRAQVAALAFVSRAPVNTACGLFDVTTHLTGIQPITEMRIVQDDKEGGRFFAPISVVVKLTFTPVAGGKREILELSRRLDFAPSPNAVWSAPDARSDNLEHEGFVLTDTDGDGEPDSFLPGTSNFAAGWPADPSLDIEEVYHCDNPPNCNHSHSTGPVPVEATPALPVATLP